MAPDDSVENLLTDEHSMERAKHHHNIISDSARLKRLIAFTKANTESVDLISDNGTGLINLIKLFVHIIFTATLIVGQ